MTDSIDEHGYTMGDAAYLQLNFDSDIRDIRRGFYAEFNVTVLQEDEDWQGK